MTIVSIPVAQERIVSRLGCVAVGLLVSAVLSGQAPVRTPTRVPTLSGGFRRPRAASIPAEDSSESLSFDTKWYDWHGYGDEMVRRIKLHWAVPELARLGWKGSLTIRFYILADGRVADAKIIRYSGIPPFDNAALQAILSSSPLLPLPAELHEEREGVTVTFLYNLRIDDLSRAPTPLPLNVTASSARPSGAEIGLPPPRPGTAARFGSVSLDQPDFQHPAYIEKLIQIISSNWYKPVQALKTSPVVHFQIQRDGTITNPFIVVSSGFPFVDRAALRAVYASSPVPPLPAGYGGPHIGIQVVFE